MEKKSTLVEEWPSGHTVLTPEEQIWFPNVLRYFHNKEMGGEAHGQLLRNQHVIMDNFLPDADLAALLAYTLEHEADFHPSQVLAKERDVPSFNVKSSVRRSVILNKIEHRYQEIVRSRIDEVLPDVLRGLGMDPFPCEKREYQLTASNDGEFFKIHVDRGPAGSPSQHRTLTYVYYFYREPKAFTGGDLRVYDTILVDNSQIAALNVQTVMPLQNRIIFFSSLLLHEVQTVYCPSQDFADSRFTFNGWLHQPSDGGL